MHNPFFSIITASYNSEATIKDTLQSVADLDYLDFEYVVIDGNSKDGTVAIIESFVPVFEEKGVVFKWRSEPDKGIYDAWNKGVEMCGGKWISFLGSDDNYLKEALKKYDGWITQSPDCNYISSKVALIDDKKCVLGVFGKPFIFRNIVKDMDIAQVGSFHKKELFGKIGKFDLQYRIVGDLDFYMRGKDIIKPAFFDEVTAQMGNGGVSNQIYTALRERLKVKLKYNYNTPIVTYFDFYWSLVKSYIKVFLKRK
jgi:glycosyltransferase involved in cell wall biosynthesis